MRQRQLSAIMTISWIFEDSRCRISSWLIRMRSGECPYFPVIFSLACIPWPRQWSLQSCPFPIFPNPELPGGWGMGSTTALADGFSSSLQHLPRPPTHLPSPLSSVSGTPPGTWPEPPVPLGPQTDCFPLAGFGSLSSLIAGTLCGCGILPKATSEFRQEKQRSQGRLTEKEF